jgi:septal ring factor EnvC (AmiA/AmiB activator)
MNKFLFLVFILSINPVFAEQTGLKPRVVKRQKSGDIKQSIAKECEKLLTSCTSLIALLAEQIDVIVKKLKMLASGDDQFFAKQKTVSLEKYRCRLEAMRKKLEQTVQETEKELTELEKNFEH